MRVAQIGNFDPPHSTENELRKALEALNCQVDTYQEGDPAAWQRLRDDVKDANFVVWTRTASELNKIPMPLQEAVMSKARQWDVPTVGYHLDIWWDLPRAREMTTVPYFRMVDFFCSADGGHEKQFADVGINHRWFPPGVSEFECVPGNPRKEFKAPLGFVGCWDGTYHKEWRHRQDLVRHLKGHGCRFWPEPGKHAVRGPDLRDLYASVDVVVGDACLVGPDGHYWSDRVPETLGRGGVLVHPRVQGMDAWFTPGEHLEVWDIGDWVGLDKIIAELQADPERRKALSIAGREHVLKHHTYTVRMQQVIDMLKEEGRL